MKDTMMLEDWRTVQLFLGENGVCEVEVDSNKPSNIRCNCKEGSTRCAHVKHVRKIMDENDGHYTISVPAEIDEMEALVAMSSAEDFRKFIVKYGKVEVL